MNENNFRPACYVEGRGKLSILAADVSTTAIHNANYNITIFVSSRSRKPTRLAAISIYFHLLFIVRKSFFIVIIIIILVTRGCFGIKLETVCLGSEDLPERISS